MKKFLLLPVVALTLAGCDQKDTWQSDCMTYHSVTDRELRQCEDRLKKADTVEVVAESVTVEEPLSAPQKSAKKK